MARDRRKDKVDIESLEKDNDRGLDSLSEKVALLRNATAGIKNEVDNQHVVLDNMDSGFSSVRGVLGSVTDKFKTVLNDHGSRKTILVLAFLTAGALFFWYMTH